MNTVYRGHSTLAVQDRCRYDCPDMQIGAQMQESHRGWPIIVGGSHRSGTTLVRRLLNGHPNIFCPAEIKFHMDLLCQFPADPLAHARLGQSMESMGLPLETWLDEFGRALCRCYEIATAKAGKERWADKSPENVINVRHWDRLLSHRMIFLFVVRHPLDIIASMAETRMDRVIPQTIEGRAAHVRTFIGAGLSFLDEHPQRSFMVRYEDLTRRPRETLSALLAQLGEAYDDQVLLRLGSDYHGRGLEDPKAAERLQVSSQSVGRWRSDLTPAQVATAWPIVASVARRLDYAIPEGATAGNGAPS